MSIGDLIQWIAGLPLYYLIAFAFGWIFGPYIIAVILYGVAFVIKKIMGRWC